MANNVQVADDSDSEVVNLIFMPLLVETFFFGAIMLSNLL
jgi:hypothetical protein